MEENNEQCLCPACTDGPLVQKVKAMLANKTHLWEILLTIAAAVDEVKKTADDARKAIDEYVPTSLADNSVSNATLQERCVTVENLNDACVTVQKLTDGCVEYLVLETKRRIEDELHEDAGSE